MADELSEAIARLKALEAENAKLREAQAKQATSRLVCKVGAKGGVSVYGFGRWPITLYAEQWTKLAQFMPQILEFVEANHDNLTFKHAE